MKIFLDFDDSLFDTKKFRGELLDVFLKHGVSRKDFFATYKDYPQKTSGGLMKYNPNLQMQSLEKKYKKSIPLVKKDFKSLMEDITRFVFPDVRKFLKSFEKRDLYLISFGYTPFQRKKIKKCGLFEKFHRVIITDKDKSISIRQIARQKGRFAFIDDRVENIDSIKKALPSSITFLLKRKEGRYNDKKTKAVDLKS